MKDCTELLKAASLPLVEWYKQNQKPLPWRSSPAPYHVWISEIMLQQTRIEAAIPYYHRFLKAFPTVEALAGAEDDALMKLWQGLGYYSRARNLKKAAVMVCDVYGGKLPEDAVLLKKLPGVGDYTAGAIASIAYGKPEPAVDGNVMRVIMRLTACAEDAALAPVRREVTRQLREIYPAGEDASMLTQGLMELGEVICVPNGAPKCGSCPLHALCRAYRENNVESYPVRSPAKPRRIEERTILLLSCGRSFALQKRPDKGLLAGLWELPALDGRLSETEVLKKLARMGAEAEWLESAGDARHIFTHVEWRMTGWRVSCKCEFGSFVWKTVREIRGELAVPAAFRHYTKQIFEEYGL